jgi:dodecin
MSMVKVIELVSSSTKSWEDAVQAAVKEAAQTLRHIKAVDVVKHSAHVNEKGELTEYRATVHVAFEVEHHSHLVGVGAKAK